MTTLASIGKRIRPKARGNITPTIIIEPAGRLVPLNLREVWEFRDLLYFMIWRDFKARYRQTVLGPLWIILQPLTSMAIYTIIFGIVAKLPSDGVPYAVFSYVGLLPWTFFSSAVSAGTGSLINNRDLISKVYFPRLITPFASVLSNLVDFGISFVILLGLLVYYGIRPTWGVVFIPVFLAFTALLGLGVGLWFAGVIVKYRDFSQFVAYLVRAWMYATPVVYATSIIPPEWRTVYALNPLTGIIQGFRWAILGTALPQEWTLALSAVVVVILFVSALYNFKRAERNIVDVA